MVMATRLSQTGSGNRENHENVGYCSRSSSILSHELPGAFAGIEHPRQMGPAAGPVRRSPPTGTSCRVGPKRWSSQRRLATFDGWTSPRLVPGQRPAASSARHSTRLGRRRTRRLSSWRRSCVTRSRSAARSIAPLDPNQGVGTDSPTGTRTRTFNREIDWRQGFAQPAETGIAEREPAARQRGREVRVHAAVPAGDDVTRLAEVRFGVVLCSVRAANLAP